MARCEDFPCCGHEPGCCPDFDDSGRQLNMKCVCGATLPLNARYSICDSCMSQGDDPDYDQGRDEPDGDEDDEPHWDGPEDLGWDGGMEL